MQRITEQEFKNALEVIKNYKAQIEKDSEIIEEPTVNINAAKLVTTVASVRLLNVIKMNMDDIGLADKEFDELIVYDLRKIHLRKFRLCRNCGKQSIQELNNIMWSANLKFKSI